MKKILLLLTAMSLAHTIVSAQKFYIQASGGYAFGFLKENMMTEDYTTKVGIDSMYDQVSVNESHLFSFGTGGRIAVGIGLKLNDYFSFELNGFYKPCKSLILESSEYYTYPNGGFFFDFNEKHTYKGNEFGVIPAMKFTFPSGSLRPYARIGVILSFMNLTYDYEGTYLTTHPLFYPTGSERSTLEASRNLNFGAGADLGFELDLADRLVVFLEANGSFISYRPKKASYTRYEVNGDDKLSEMTVNEKEIEYVKSYTSTESVDENSPQKRLYISFPFSAIGLSAGLRFKFFQ